MANNKSPPIVRNMMYNGKHSLLPPKSPFPVIPTTYTSYIPNNPIGPKPRTRESHPHHQRTSSESFLPEEQPSWLDELLNEPETPIRRGHRRSSSDSFAYIDASIAANVDYAVQEEYKFKNLMPDHSWIPQQQHHQHQQQHSSFYGERNILGRPKNRAWNSSLNSLVHPSGLLSTKDNFVCQNKRSSETEQVPSTASEKQDTAESGPPDAKAALERKDLSCAEGPISETDTKRAKQQFAQRSRVRKLQYIAELERNVQALQAEGTQFSAEIEFINQRNLILGMENSALKQRLENLAQEQLIKHLEHEVLEREIGRLRSLFQQQQQPQQPQQPQQQPQSSTSHHHRRSNSRDLESQFANLNIKQHKDVRSGRDSVTGTLHI